MSDNRWPHVYTDGSGGYYTPLAPETVTEFKVVPFDAIVIERGEVPEVDTTDGVVADGCGWDAAYIAAYPETVERSRRQALAFLAIAEYLAAHPPVDEAQVEALTGDISSFVPGEPVDEIRFRDLARRLVEQGWTKPEPTS